MSAALPVSGQALRTAYFMENSTIRSSMNPAMRPRSGYVNIPVIGGTSFAYSSNGLRVENLFYPNPNGEGLVTFLDKSVNTEDFLSHINKKNRIDADLSLNLFGMGIYRGNDFWTFDINLKTDADMNIPGEFFEFAKRGSGLDGAEYRIRDMKMRLGSTIEASVGYSRPVSHRLTLGGRIKLIGGLANANFRYDDMRIKMNGGVWELNAKGGMDLNIAGMEHTTKIEDGKEIIDLDNLKYNLNGLAGFGAGIDLGATYQLMYNLSLSAALVDLGFVRWSGRNAVSGVMNGHYLYRGFYISDDPSEKVGSTIEGNFDDLSRFESRAGRGRTTGLRTTINLGAEYTILDDLLGFGLLSSTQFRPSGTVSELTAVASVRPLRSFSAALSYSMFHSGFDTFGFALNYNPSWINFFIGADYMVTRATEEFIPLSQNSANVYFGLAVPIGYRR